MNTCFRRVFLVTGIALALVGCTKPAPVEVKPVVDSPETTAALQKAATLESQQAWPDANAVLIDALQNREVKLRSGSPTPTDSAAANALVQKIEGDPEILKMERVQVMIYLHMERADLASAVYRDILVGQAGDAVVGDALKEKDPLVRIGAVRILGLTGTPDVIPALTGATHDEDKEVRRAATSALGTIKDPKAVDPLIAALKDPYWFTRSEAAEALGREGDLRAVKPLLETVGDPDDTVEGAAESALLLLAQITPSVSADQFAGKLHDPNPKVVMIAVCCLAVQKDARAVPVLLGYLGSNDIKIRLQALKALGVAGDPSVLPVVRQLLFDPSPDIRQWAIVALDNLKDTDSLPALRALANDTYQPAIIQETAKTAVSDLDKLVVPTGGT